ncbi:MAG: FimV/HubP family polar landmark protein [Pseudomonadota bacterium]
MRISGLLSALLLVYGSAQGAGLGKLSVQSALGQPLRAEIELLSVTKEELSGISAQLASRDLFRQARIERSGALSNLEFGVAQRANGQPVIRITSATPIADPFLDMLIELNWSTGRIIREYTVLLDPPVEGRAAAPAQPKAVPVAGASETKSPEVVAKPPAENADKPAQAVDKPAASNRYGPIKSGETLRSIAGRVKDADVTLEQMMAGLYMANKPAFIDNNMNLLKKGAVLKVPSADAVHRQVSPSQALRMIQNHVDEWHAYRSKVAGVAEDTPDARQDKPAAAGAITPKVQDKSGTSAAPKDVLQLSKGVPATGGKQDAKTQERLQSLEEELAAKARALQESQDRVAQLERAVRDMQELLQLKSQAAQQTPPPAAPEAPAAVEPPPAPEPAPAEPPAAPVAKPAPLPPPPVTPVEEEGSWLSTFLRNPIYIGGVVAALLLSGLLWMMMAGNRRRKGLNKFEDSIMTGGEFKSGAVFNTGGADATASAPANTEGSMLLTDFSRLGLGAIDTHEVDPIAEAEVYMAYGRDAQAEEILKEALDKDSSRHEIALKLLEIYAARKDPLAFETTASELYAGLGGQDTPVWQRAAEMGRSIDPDNPLYRMAQGQAFGPAADAKIEQEPAAKVELPSVSTPDLDAGLDFTAEPVPPPVAESLPAETAELGQADNGLDFTSSFDQPLDEATAKPAVELEPVDLDFEPVPASEPAREPEGLDFDLAVPEPAAEPEPVFEAEEAIEIAAPVAEAPKEDEAILPELDLSDIDLNLELPAAESTAQETSDELVAPSLEPMADMDFQPAEAEAAPAAPAEPPAGVDPVLWEEVNTKLDLARAYLEMGDREGAREILQEVVQEGDGNQQSEARKLLDEAG